MPAADNVIGQGACPVCDNLKAVFKFSGKALAYCTCNSCNVQVFARSDRSDELLRKRVKAIPADAVLIEAVPLDLAIPLNDDKPPVKVRASWGLGAFK